MIIIEYTGILAFALCGAMAAMDRGADVFGVIFLGVITALGGGVLRDLLLGALPPRMFTSSGYVALALGASLAVFLVAWRMPGRYRLARPKLDQVLNVLDALGLAAFTVSGADIAMESCGMDQGLAIVLLGMTTGVGGGMLKDVLIDAMPAVLYKRVYAVASLAGAVTYYTLLSLGLRGGLSAAGAMVLIFALRILATVYKWTLPHVPGEKD